MSIKQKKTAIKNPTLLEDFFRDRLSKYVEPSRKGTAKGDAIGLSRTKYKASLCFLYEFDARGTGGVKGVAKVLGVSYPLLKNWRSEEEFKKTMLLHMVEFTDVFFNFIDELHQRKFKSYQAFLKKPLKQITTGADPSHIELADLQPISDYHRYSVTLQYLLLKQWEYELTKWDGLKASTAMVVLNSMMLSAPKQTPERKEAERRINLLLVDDLIGVATKRSLSESERLKYIVYGLRVLRKMYEKPEDPSK